MYCTVQTANRLRINKIMQLQKGLLNKADVRSQLDPPLNISGAAALAVPRIRYPPPISDH
jgi:hypothetical protein